MTPLDPPSALCNLGFRHLFALEVTVDALQVIGQLGAERRVGPIASGRFEGPRLRGRVGPGGSDWQTVTPDGTTRLDARLVLETDAGELIGMTFSGIRHGPPQVMARLAAGEPVDPADYDFRIQATFSTGANGAAWLNLAPAVGMGHRLPGGPIYNLFEMTWLANTAGAGQNRYFGVDDT